MRGITHAAVGAALLACATPATAQNAPADRAAPRIQVVGHGSVDRLPDRITVAVEIVTNDDVASRATSANNATYDAFVAKEGALGIAPAAIRTTGYAIRYNPHPAPQSNPPFAQRYGYVVTRSATVSSDRTDQAGAIVDAAVAAGVGTVDAVSFGLRDERAAYRDAQAQAVADAQAQARGLAAAAHVRIVRLVWLSDGSPSAPRAVGGQTFMAAAAAPPTVVPPSNLTVSAAVTASYEVAP